ncbi:Dyp-type peroxidase [Streptomyces sp. NRRL S-87]|uniref:Dyp-type peroxidase n=1 Tax=Streptomyces sp. NRRL S-87 TaxID=1463920 RepID=UPI00068E4095|nr:Dyp-type peroxidase [Streptomyces sp. NRRL S-87]
MPFTRRTVVRAGGAAAAALAVGNAVPAEAAPAVAATTPTAPVPKAAGQELPLRTDTTTQGDILAGFRKDQACLFLIRFGAVDAARGWLRALLPELSSTEQVAQFNTRFSRARRLRSGADPTTMSALWTGLSLTHAGLGHLAQADPFPAVPPGGTAEAFRDGPGARAERLGDTGTSAPGSWLFGAAADAVHAVLTLASDKPDVLAQVAARHRDALQGAGAEVVFRQDAATLPGALRGHEHFGFLDAISQPGVRGFHPADATGTGVEGKPGTRLLPAGEFIVGQERVGQRPAGLPAWATGGSFQVVRRLAQDVPGWWSQARELLKQLQKSGAAPADADTRWLAARFVGRWPSGAPVATCPMAEKPVPPGTDAGNDFDFHDDPEGRTTPLFAHIRKTSPRGGFVTTPGRPPLAASALDTRRIIRRGIPYGPAHREDSSPVPRGLVFVSYQADLVEQFEFIARQWSNNEDFPPGRHPQPGADTVIGTSSPVAFESASPSGGRATTLDFQRFVRTEGALYAFTPSIPTLRALAGGSLDTAIEVHPGTVLRPGDTLDAGAVRLRLEDDGDLVLLAADGRTLWSAGTAGSGADALFAADGELTVRDAAGKPLWSSRTAGAPGARLLVRPSGDAVVLRDGRAVWSAPTPS